MQYLVWLEAYIQKQSVKVKIRKSTSEIVKVKRGVPVVEFSKIPHQDQDHTTGPGFIINTSQ